MAAAGASAPEIVPEDHAPPVVLGLAATLKRAAERPELARRLRRMKGVVALRSSVDRQSVTVRFDRGRVQLTRGVAPDAGLVITLDFDNMSGPGAPKPQVKGAMRHPLLGLSVARVLEPPTGTWQEEAARFWSFASSEPRMPGSMLVACTDDGGQLRLGAADGPPAYELHGPASALVSVFSGQTIAGQEFLAGKLKAVGSFEHASVLTGRSIAWVLGEGR